MTASKQPPLELIQNIDRDLLPQSLRQLSDVMNMEAALKLVYAMPGIRLYVPEAIVPGHYISDLVGLEQAQKLSAEFAREYIQLPNTTSIEQQLRDQQLARMKDQGSSNRECALRLGITQRSIERKLAKFRDENQLDMFKVV